MEYQKLYVNLHPKAANYESSFKEQFREHIGKRIDD